VVALLNLKDIDAKELAQLSRLEEENFVTPWSIKELRSVFQSGLYSLVGLFLDEEMVAYYILVDSFDVYELARIAVSKKYRGHGYSKLLMEDMLEKSEKNIFLEVREGNVVAVSLYSNFGFRIVGKRKAYYSDTGEDAIVMMFEK
jgi:ribosomal-protein-alanine N-acetyltransferase